MLPIVIVVFVSVFAMVALLAAAFGAGASRQKEISERLSSALATSSRAEIDLLVDVRKNEALSSIPWLDRALRNLELTPRLRRLLSQADVPWTVGFLMFLSAAAFLVVAYLLYWRTGAILFGLVGGAAAAWGPFGYVSYKRRQRLARFEEGLPEALDLICSALRVGHSLNSAMGLVTRECAAPVGPEFRITFDEQNYGLELKTALENMITRVPVQDLRIVVTGILIQKESGGNLAEVLEKTAEVIRERFRLRRQVLTHTAQGRLTGLVLTLLPIILGFALYCINPDVMSVLWKRDLGQKMLYAGSGMIVIGGMIIRKIVNMEV